MAATFVPFFEKVVSGESMPQYQFNQYKLSKVALAPTDGNTPKVDRKELRAKAASDLRNALRMSLPPEDMEHFAAQMARYRGSERPVGSPPEEELDGEFSGESGEQADKPAIHLQKEGDKITKINVECVCGQIIPMDCIY